MRNAAAPVTVTLPRSQWDTFARSLMYASYAFDGPGWCWCPESIDEICDKCARREADAYIWREIAEAVSDRVGIFTPRITRSTRITLVRTAETWSESVQALREGATHLAGSFGYDCFPAYVDDLCEECIDAQREVRAMRALADRIDRRVRRTHARADRPEVAAFLNAELAAINQKIDGIRQGDMRTSGLAHAEDRDYLRALTTKRDQLARHLTGRATGPRRRRARH